MPTLAVSTIEPVSDPGLHRVWQDELKRITSSSCFAGAMRIRSLLVFLVQETLAGRGDRLKEYVIGVDVFGRGEDFDPRVDTNVRTEAWRLRSRLDQYYAHEGALNPARIALPRRSFIPVLRVHATEHATCGFDAAQPVSSAAGETGCLPTSLREAALADVLSAAPHTLSLAIERFRTFSSGAPGLGTALYAELLLELGDHPGLKIFSESDEAGGGHLTEAAFLLRGEICLAEGHVRILVRLVRSENGQLEWSYGCDHALSGDINVARRLAHDIARAFLTSPVARTTGFNRPPATREQRGRLVWRILSSGLESAAIDLAAVQREARRVEYWLLHHPQDNDAHCRLASLLSWCACVAPTSVSSFASLLGRCTRQLLSQSAPPVDTLVELGFAAMADFDWFGALDLLHAAVRADPTSSDARVVRGLCALHLGQAASAQLDLETACRVDPRSALAYSTLGVFHYQQHRFAEAATLARKALALDAHCEPAAVLLADSELCECGMDEGVDLVQRARSWSTRRPVILGRLGHLCAVTGRRQLAQSLLRELLLGSGGSMPAHAALADIYLGLGDADSAFEQLGHAVDQRVLPDLLLLRFAPRYDGLRHDVRFRALMDQMALPMAG